MALQVKVRKKDNHFRFYTTISESWLSNWMPKWKAIKFLQDRVMNDAKDECEEIAVKFPHGYWDMDSKFIKDEKGEKAYKKLLEDRVNNFS